MNIKPLPNIGLSCFANTALQCLWNATKIRSTIDRYKKESVTCEFVFNIMTNSCNQYNIRKLLKHLNIPLNTEYDANEFTLILIDKIIHETKTDYKSTVIEHDDDITNFSIKDSKAWWTKNTYSPIVEKIYGQQLNLIQHDNCNYVMRNFDYFNQLSLFASTKSNNVKDMLINYLKTTA